MMKGLNKLKASTVCHVARFNFPSWARAVHAPTGDAEREVLLEKGGTRGASLLAG